MLKEEKEESRGARGEGGGNGARARIPPKVAVVFHRLGPYHHARLNAAAARVPITAVESCGLDATYAWDKVDGAKALSRVTLVAREQPGPRWRRIVKARLWEELNQLKPGVVAVPGWSSPEALSALEWCMSNSRPAVLMSESARQDEIRRPWKEWVKRRVVRLCSAALVGGRLHVDYLVELGMPRERISLGYDAVDNDYFANHGRPTLKPALRNYFLASARFVAKKNLPRLIEAFALYRKNITGGNGANGEVTRWDLVLLGDGAMRPFLETQVAELNLQDHIIMPGFKQYAELPAYYGSAGAFVHASTTEQWGLVLNEAMASGLPVLVSSRCGCAPDLVKEGVNGFTFDPLKIEQLAGLMRRMADMAPAQRAEIGARSRALIAHWGTERFANGLQQAVETALGIVRPRATLLDRLLLRALALP